MCCIYEQLHTHTHTHFSYICNTHTHTHTYTCLLIQGTRAQQGAARGLAAATHATPRELLQQREDELQQRDGAREGEGLGECDEREEAESVAEDVGFADQVCY